MANGEATPRRYQRGGVIPGRGEVSRRQYDQWRREQGLLAPKQPAPHQMSRYETSLHAYATKHNLTIGQARNSSERKLLWQTIRRESTRPKDKKNPDADGAWAQALVDIGLRDPEETNPVGHSTKKKK